ncbi:hypothetical protein ACH79_20685 [Bradyrhizobium sp. CCBAU 051011]|nr:hypothetical protein ACH79_20685 [Bradyrhizobium sp. CCBAU 051011]
MAARFAATTAQPRGRGSKKCPLLPTFSIEEDLFGLACRNVGPPRNQRAPPLFGVRCQTIVFFRHFKQAALVLDRIRG